MHIGHIEQSFIYWSFIIYRGGAVVRGDFYFSRGEEGGEGGALDFTMITQKK